MDKEQLPPRVYRKHGALYYVDLERRWHRLGKAWDLDARQKWAELSAGAPTAGSVSELLTDYLKHFSALVRAEKRSPRTLQDYQDDRVYLDVVFGRYPATSITDEHVARYLLKRNDKHGNPAPTRANREIAFLSAAYGWAKDRRLLKTNPCDGVPRNETADRDRYVRHDERRRFAKHCCPDWLRAYLLLKYLTGLRQVNLLELRRQDVTAAGLLARVAKKRGRKQVIFRWTRSLRIVVDWLLAQERREGVRSLWLFPTRDGDRYTVAGFKSAWQRAMAQWESTGGDRFWEHDIRAKAGSDSASTGAAQELLQHASRAVTEKHYRRAPAKVRPLR